MRIVTMLAGLGAIGIAAAATSAAAQNAMQVCGAKYQAAKKANQLPAGQTWNQYLAQCRAGMAKPAVAPATASSAATAQVHTTTVQKSVTTTRPAGQRTPGQLAEASRERQCGAQWKADKAAGKTGSQTWPQYWSACSKRLKGA